MPGPILLFGSTGYFGGHMLRYLQSIGVPTVCAKARLENRADLIEEIAQIKPRYIIMAAGIAGTPNIDWCETHREETIRVNGILEHSFRSWSLKSLQLLEH